MSPGLVDINASLAYQNMQVEGTGVVLSAGGEVLTNNHVIDGATAISVTDVGNGLRYQASVVGYDRSLDIAVLQLTNASGLQMIRSGESSSLRIRQGVVALGNAGGLGGTPSAAAGTVVALDQRIVATNEGNGSSERLTGLIGVDAAVQPGDSGGSLVDASGRVMGIDTAASADFWLSSGSSQGFAIPIDSALSIANRIEDGRPSAGVHIGPTALLGIELTASVSSGASQNGRGATVAAVVPVPRPSRWACSAVTSSPPVPAGRSTRRGRLPRSSTLGLGDDGWGGRQASLGNPLPVPWELATEGVSRRLSGGRPIVGEATRRLGETASRAAADRSRDRASGRT